MSLRCGDLVHVVDLMDAWIVMRSRFGRDRFPRLGRMATLVRVQYTGHRRHPKAGDWYISGAIPEGYFARTDLHSVHCIGVLVTVQTDTITTVTDTIHVDQESTIP